MSDCKDKRHPIQRPGTSQQDRIIPALQPGSAPMHEWRMKDYLKFAYDYARHVRFFDLKSDQLPKGDWQVFFESFNSDEELQKFLRALGTDSGNIEPHIALFICFLYLLGHSQDHLNKFTGRHLDFYYKKVLQLSQKAPVNDQVHLVFELAKNATLEKVPGDTALNGGKDAAGKLRHYKTTDELALNASSIGQLKNILHVTDPNVSVNLSPGLYYAVNANKADGLEADPEDGLWSAFGHDKLTTPQIGLTVASPLLNLREGDRWIQLNMAIDTSLITADGGSLSYSKDELINFFDVYLTGEKGWLGPFPLHNGELPDVGDDVDVSIKESSLTENELHLLFNIPISVDPIVPLNPAVIADPVQTSYPVARIVFKLAQENEEAFQLYKVFRKTIINSTYLDVWVVGMKELIVENDLGPVNPSKPFFPFGSQPSVGSNFFIGNHEIFTKNWQKINVNVSWKGLPSDDSGVTDFPGLYAAYRKNYLKDISKSIYDLTTGNEDNDAFGGGRVVTENAYFESGISVLRDKNWQPLSDVDDSSKTGFNLFKNDAQQLFSITRKGASSITEGSVSSGGTGSFFSWNIPFMYYLPATSTYTESVVQSYTVGHYNTVFNMALFNVGAVESSKKSENLNAGQQKGFIKFSLRNHFFHRNYPNLYAVAAGSELEEKLIPNEPYTPQVEAITIDYFATTRVDDGSTLKSQKVRFSAEEEYKKEMPGAFANDPVQIFHQGPFGFARQHTFLKDQAIRMHMPKKLEFREVTDNTIRLAPDFFEVGQFMIGIEHIDVNQTVSILFQVAEGSENPVLDPFTNEDKIDWHVLSNNEWIYLNRNYVLEDTTNNLLQPGIIKFLIPREATLFNTWLDAGLIWLRATITKHPDRVPKMIALHTNAVKAQFSDQGNDLKHLDSALPAGTISKMINRLAKIKKVSQPYASFDGKPEENLPDFYKRVSERLRHKQRAVTLWDYEQLVLEKFPEIHKVKNLNHTKYLDDTDMVHEFSPGYVTLVVVPDLRNKNFYDPLQPRVSQNKLSQINNFLKPLCSMHVNFRAINPHYETVRFEVEVVFMPGKDPVLYLQQLQTDLILFLSPWVENPEKGIQFGGVVHRSMVISYIESLDYIDYITDLKMLHDGSLADGGIIETISSASILVSAPEHKVSNIIPEVCSS